ncbi:MAG TPA: hypothetical protein VH476_10535 [Solirubrobacterales bacterium]|jgi:hypothetical protein
MSTAVGLLWALLGSLALSLVLWAGHVHANPGPAVDWSDCGITVRHSMGVLETLGWEERYHATIRCKSDKPKPDANGELRMLTIGSANEGSIFGEFSCSMEAAIKKGDTYPCVDERTNYCIGKEEKRYPVARLIISRGRGFKVVASARSSPMSLDCRPRVVGFFNLHLEASAVEGREVAGGSAKSRSG